MTQRRRYAVDAMYLVFYVGVWALAVAVLGSLFALYAFEVRFGSAHITAAAMIAVAVACLPVAARTYRSLVGRSFAWRQTSDNVG